MQRDGVVVAVVCWWLMFPEVKLSHIRKSAADTWKEVSTFFTFLWFGLFILFNWSKEFATINAAYSFLIPKMIVILIGALVTGIPFLLLVPIAFLPTRVVAPIFFVGFVVVFVR